MSSIYRFQMSGFKISVSTLAMRYWQRQLPFLYPWLHHGFAGRVFHRAGMNFLLSFELSLNQILRSILPIISQYGWRENDNVQCNQLTSQRTSVPVNHSQISLIPRGGDTVKEQNTSYLPPPGDRSLIKSAYMLLLSPYLSRVRGGGGFN